MENCFALNAMLSACLENGVRLVRCDIRAAFCAMRHLMRSADGLMSYLLANRPVGARALRLAAQRHHRNAQSATPHLYQDSCLRPLWPQRAGIYLGKHRQGSRAACGCGPVKARSVVYVSVFQCRLMSAKHDVKCRKARAGAKKTDKAAALKAAAGR